LPFSRSAGQAAERQKPISLFEGVHLVIKTEQRSDMNVRQQYHRPLWLSFPAESGMPISRFRPRFQRGRPETERKIKLIRLILSENILNLKRIAPLHILKGSGTQIAGNGAVIVGSVFERLFCQAKAKVQ